MIVVFRRSCLLGCRRWGCCKFLASTAVRNISRSWPRQGVVEDVTVLGSTSKGKDNRAKLGLDIYSFLIEAMLIKVVVWDPCPFGLQEM